MDRVIYCPSEEMLPEAERLSRLHLLPILLGENERTIDLEFDRSKPIPLTIPVSHFFALDPGQPVTGEKFLISYKNEFLQFDDSVYFTLFSHVVGEPNGHHRLTMNQKERHFAKSWVNVHVPADFTFFVWKDDKKLFSFDFSVKEKNV